MSGRKTTKVQAANSGNVGNPNARTQGSRPALPVESLQTVPQNPEGSVPQWMIVRIDPPGVNQVRFYEGSVEVSQRNRPESSRRAELYEPTLGTIQLMLERLPPLDAMIIRQGIAAPMVNREIRMTNARIERVAAGVASVSNPTSGSQNPLEERKKKERNNSESRASKGNKRDKSPPPKATPKERSAEWNAAHAKMEAQKKKVKDLNSKLQSVDPDWSSKLQYTEKLLNGADKQVLLAHGEAVKKYKTLLAAFNAVKSDESKTNQASGNSGDLPPLQEGSGVKRKEVKLPKKQENPKEKNASILSQSDGALDPELRSSTPTKEEEEARIVEENRRLALERKRNGL